ncbi:MAG: ribonuclease Z [Gemmatimonadota bacterium]|nr:MAG: ribonuclease Z [Gemmatimonadota bacterium]
MLRVMFIGTSSARPTVSRNTSALAVQRGADLYLFDCGEGTQRQMMRYGVGFMVREIYLTHMHADHYLGVVGLLRTMSLQDRLEALAIYTPPGGEELLRQAVGLELAELSFPVRIEALVPDASNQHDGYSISAYAVSHPGGANGYVLRESARPGRFYPERALELGVPEGPLFGRLQRGEAVLAEDGRQVEPGDVMGPPRPGRTVVYTGDTRPCDSTVKVAAGCDLLIHEATFSDDEVDRAQRTGHSTARQAGEVAQAAGVHRLVLTHLSARYSERAYVLEREAKRACGGACEVLVAYDGLTIEVPFRDAEEAEP